MPTGLVWPSLARKTSTKLETTVSSTSEGRERSVGMGLSLKGVPAEQKDSTRRSLIETQSRAAQRNGPLDPHRTENAIIGQHELHQARIRGRLGLVWFGSFA